MTFGFVPAAPAAPVIAPWVIAGGALAAKFVSDLLRPPAYDPFKTGGTAVVPESPGSVPVAVPPNPPPEPEYDPAPGKSPLARPVQPNSPSFDPESANSEHVPGEELPIQEWFSELGPYTGRARIRYELTDDSKGRKRCGSDVQTVGPSVTKSSAGFSTTNAHSFKFTGRTLTATSICRGDEDGTREAVAEIQFFAASGALIETKKILRDSGTFVNGFVYGSSTYSARPVAIEFDDGRTFDAPLQAMRGPNGFVPVPEPYPEPETRPDEKPLAPPSPGSPPPLPKAPPSPQQIPGVDPFPIPGTPSQPDPNPGPDPAPGPSPSTSPGISPNPKIPVPAPSSVPGLDPATTTQTTPAGLLAAKPKPKPAITPSDAHFPVPGKPPVTKAGARPTVAAVSKEVGRLEQKVQGLMGGNPGLVPDWVTDLLLAIGLLSELLDGWGTSVPGTTYQVTENCTGKDYGDDGPPKWDVSIDEAPDAMAAVLARLDALATLEQGNFELAQKTCGTRVGKQGKWVTVNFESDANSPQNNRPLRKQLRYRDLSNSDASAHSRHWDSFTWEAGPVCCTFRSEIVGVLQVWAASESEGKRVINFAAAISGFSTDSDGEWQIAFSSNPRFGQFGSMRVKKIWGFNSVSKRDGSSGPPELWGV